MLLKDLIKVVDSNTIIDLCDVTKGTSIGSIKKGQGISSTIFKESFLENCEVSRIVPLSDNYKIMNEILCPSAILKVFLFT